MPRAACEPVYPRGRNRPITYQLHIRIAGPLYLTIGRLGRFFFPAGNYVYTGSARRQLEARIARHLRDKKTLRWHIDWLLTAPGACVVGVTRSKLAECELNQRTVGKILAHGFGASDCRKHCDSHLLYLGKASRRRKYTRRQSLLPG